MSNDPLDDALHAGEPDHAPEPDAGENFSLQQLVDSAIEVILTHCQTGTSVAVTLWRRNPDGELLVLGSVSSISDLQPAMAKFVSELGDSAASGSMH
jgi:hypothetical protein